ncbi:MAG: hypothetical protein ABI579_09160, partial [Candidatus Sumerlaeota bacterium]
DTPRRSFAGAPCAPPFCSTVTARPSGAAERSLPWGSAPHPGSVACGAPTLRAVPSRARCERLYPVTAPVEWNGTPRTSPMV